MQMECRIHLFCAGAGADVCGMRVNRWCLLLSHVGHSVCCHQVRYTCSRDAKENVVLSVREFPSCNYVLVVSTPFLCKHPAFAPPVGPLYWHSRCDVVLLWVLSVAGVCTW